MNSADHTPKAKFASFLRTLALLYKPNRFAMFAIGTMIAIGSMVSAANAQVNCIYEGIRIKLCDVPVGWQVMRLTNPLASVEFHRGDGFSAQLFIESSGTDQGLTLAAAANVVALQMRNTVGEDNFEIIDQGTTHKVFDSETLVYRANIEGIPFIFANTIYVGRKESIQILTWRIGRDWTEESRSAHFGFWNSLVLMPDF